MNKTLLYFKTWMKATGRNLVSAKVLSLVVLLSAVPYAAFSGNGSLSEVSESMQAGTQTVSGTVQDQDGTPLIGVTVTSSQSNGVVTDVNGKFTIKVPSGAELTFSYLGYKTVKVKVGARTTILSSSKSKSWSVTGLRRKFPWLPPYRRLTARNFVRVLRRTWPTRWPDVWPV